MDLILDQNGPLHSQLARALKAAMASGRLPDGTRLPASRQLAGDLTLSRTTVVSAYEQLRAEGYLSGKVGSGSYVKSPWHGIAAVSPDARRSILPQSLFSRRARIVHQPSELFGQRPPAMRYAFQFSLPLMNNTVLSQWGRELTKCIRYVKPNYPMPQGLPQLREMVCRHISRTRGVRCTPDDILITNGTQQSLALISMVLLDQNDHVAIEDPGYFAARKIFQMHGANTIGVGVDVKGLITSELPGGGAKLIYTTPSHQFPTGAVMSLERRSALLDYARECGGWICEDDYDGEFRHDVEPVEALQSLDRDGRVIYLGSFSKTLFPALRLGYMVVPSGLRQDFITAKWADDFGSPPFEQTALAGLIQSGAYDRHLRHATRKLAERRSALISSLEELCGHTVEILPSHSGMHTLIWMRGMTAADGDAFMRLAYQQNLGLYPVGPCFLDGVDKAGFIMGFGSMSTREIREAVELFAHCLRIFLNLDIDMQETALQRRSA